jgi:G3E family GTPase
MTEKIPVTLLVGFLGSGKTTLINKILSGDHKLKIAVIENEFGSINIDQEFIEKPKDMESYIIEMNNGCLCCSMNGDLVQTLQKLLERRKDYNHIVIEATGMANPGPIIQVFTKAVELIDNFKLNTVVSLVDSKNFSINLENTKKDKEFSLEEQLLFSDLILLNKKDLIPEELREFELGNIKKFITKLNSHAELKETEFCNIDIKELLKRDSYSLENLDNLSLAPHHNHGQGEIGQISVELEGDFNPEQFQLFLNSLFMTYRNRLFRLKGVLSFPHNPKRILLQGVNDQIEFVEGRKKDKDHHNMFVFVGIDLKREVILKSLQNCLIKP